MEWIKWNWKNILGLVLCVAALFALNAFVLKMTCGCYNLIEFLFM